MTEANGKGFNNLLGTFVWLRAVQLSPGMCFPCCRGLLGASWFLAAKVREPNKNRIIGIQKPNLSASPYALRWLQLDS